MVLPVRGLVTPAALVAALEMPGLVVLDVRSVANGGGRAAFEQAHVPGARHTDYAADGWRVKVGGAPGVMPAPDAIAAIAGRLGLEPRHHLVLVVAGLNASDFAAAARIAWSLRMIGHEKIAILDGGMAGWTAAGLPVQSGSPVVPATSYPVGRPAARRVQAGDIVSGAGALVDARSESYFHGREKASEAKAAGHIPGALNIDYATAYDLARQALRRPEELAALFAGVPAGPVVSYCNTGHTAALNWFVLSELLGRDVALYDGSMTDWTQDPARPVAT